MVFHSHNVEVGKKLMNNLFFTADNAEDQERNREGYLGGEAM